LIFYCACAAQASQEDLTDYYIKSAMPCGGDSIISGKGTWKKSEDAIIFPDKTFPRNQFNQLNSRIDNIFPLFKEALPDLRGFEAKMVSRDRWKFLHSQWPGALRIFKSLPFLLLQFKYKKVQAGDETVTWDHGIPSMLVPAVPTSINFDIDGDDIVIHYAGKTGRNELVIPAKNEKTMIYIYKIGN